MTTPTIEGSLTLGHVIAATGIDPPDVIVLRHTYKPDGLRSEADLTPDKILDYTRRHGIGNKLGSTPPKHWLVFIADGARRSRLIAAFENDGEATQERTDTRRFFNLRPSPLLSALGRRLVIEWSRDPVNWAKSGPTAAKFPVMEIADPEAMIFPGFDQVLVDYAELRDVVADSRYESWRTALGAVQGIYLIADTSTGKLYVGKADGQERILGRWRAYAGDSHGGNVALRELAGLDPTHAQNFQFSILRVYGPSVPATEVNDAESHFKRALLTRSYGLNRN